MLLTRVNRTVPSWICGRPGQSPRVRSAARDGEQGERGNWRRHVPSQPRLRQEPSRPRLVPRCQAGHLRPLGPVQRPGLRAAWRRYDVEKAWPARCAFATALRGVVPEQPAHRRAARPSSTTWKKYGAGVHLRGVRRAIQRAGQGVGPDAGRTSSRGPGRAMSCWSPSTTTVSCSGPAGTPTPHARLAADHAT